MRGPSFFASPILSFAALVVAYAVMTALHVPVGEFRDWVFGLLAALWLLAVVTVPWNVHFRARAVLADVPASRARGLPVDDRQVAYVRTLAARALWLALALHLASAAALFALAHFGVSPIGYVASVLALLLTGLRPAASAYEYLAARLRSIGEQWRYPHEDVVELRGRLAEVESALVQARLDLDPARPESAVARLGSQADQARDDLARVGADLAALRAANDADHDRLARDARSAISQLSTDGQFLDHVREILRFFKSA